MEATIIAELITTIGFPIAVCFALGWFIYKIYKDSQKREDELRAEIRENQAINRDSIKTLALYAERLDIIQTDIEVIKDDIVTITEKIS